MSLHEDFQPKAIRLLVVLEHLNCVNLGERDDFAYVKWYFLLCVLQLSAAVNWLSAWLKTITLHFSPLVFCSYFKKLHLRKETESKGHFSFDQRDFLEMIGCGAAVWSLQGEYNAVSHRAT